MDTWNSEQGLPNNTVNAITQTRDGFLWVGTDNGLARFDGKQFRSFAPQNITALGSGRVSALCGDGSGALWISTLEPMLVRFKDGEFAVVGPGDSIGHEKIVSLNHDGNVLWCANDHGVIGKLEHGTYLPVATNVAAVAASLKLVHREGGLGPTALSQVLDQRLQAGQLERLAGIAPGALRFAAPGRAGWWLGTESFLKALGESNQISLVDLPTNILSSTRVALEDRQGNLWLGTEQHGLWCRGNDGTMQAYSTTNGLGGDTVLCLFEDRQGAIWVGCEGGGLNRLRPRPFHVLPRSSAIWGEPATAVCEGRPGELWVGTEHNGLCRLANGLAQPVGLGQMPPIRRIRSLKFDSTQRLWVGTQEDGLFYFQDGVLGAFRSLLRVRQVSALFEERSLGIVAGDRNGEHDLPHRG